MADILSAPHTIIFVCLPASINLLPVSRAYKKPEHAALMSKLHALVAPTLCDTMLAVEGKTRSGVTVATMIRSISSAVIPRFLRS